MKKHGMAAIPRYRGRLVTASHIFVSFNYFLGLCAALISDDRGIYYAAYCIIFTFIWGAFAWIGNYLMRTDRLLRLEAENELVEKSNDDEAIDCDDNALDPDVPNGTS